MAIISSELRESVEGFLKSLYDIDDPESRRQLGRSADFPDNLIQHIQWETRPSAKFVAHLVDRTLAWGPYDDRDERQPLVEYLKATNALGGGDHLRTLGELLERLRHELVDVASQPQQSAALPPPIKFVNREDELRQLMNEASLVARYAIHAPAGYGKTWLLNRLHREFATNGWVAAKATLMQDTSVHELVSQLLQSIDAPLMAETNESPLSAVLLARELKRQWARRSKGIVLVIDLADLPMQVPIFAELVRDWFDYLANEIKGLKYFSQGENHFRIFIGGRFFDPQILNLLRIDGAFDIFTLQPFREKVIEQSIKQYLPGLIPEWQTDLWSSLFYMSGGHPKCFTEMLQQYWKHGGHPEPSRFFRDEFEELLNILIYELNEIVRDLPEQTRDLLVVLSTYRYSSYEVLDQILQMPQGIISWEGDSVSLADHLTQTHLVSWDTTNYLLRDSITRRMMELSVRYSGNSRTSFETYFLNAKSVYRERLVDKNEDRVLLVRWAIEYLYSSLQAGAHMIDNVQGRAELRRLFWGLDDRVQGPDQGTDLYTCLTSLVDGRDGRRLLQALQLALSEEWEFQFTLNYFLRGQHYKTDCFRVLLGKIQAFLSSTA